MIKIVIICIACIWLCTTWLLVESTFPFPPAKDVFVVLNVPDLVELLEQPGLQHRHIVSFLTPDIGHDPYITLYMGLLLDLLEDRDAQDFAELEAMQSYDPRVDAFSSTTRDLSLNTTVVIFQANSSEITIFEAGLVMLSVLPATSTFISIQHGSHQIGLQHLQRYQSLLRLPLPSMLMHFNHERPWIVDYSMHLDFTFPSVNRLQEEYGKYDVVVRSYFFEPVTGTEAPIRTNPPLEQSTKQTHKNKDGERKVHAHYLPIFAPYQKHIVENISSSLYREAIATKASQRPFKCWFKGRINYDYDQLYDDEIIAEGVEGEVQNVSFSKMSASERYRATSSAEYERQVLIDLLQHHPTLSSTCTMEVKGFQPGEVFQVEEHYHPYMEKLAKTVFSLCPSGNNPETFRLHESLEMGSIPIIVRQNNSERDFLRHDYWNGYPGPVLNNWHELSNFFDEMTPARMDELQGKVFSWYKRFKQRVRHNIRSLFYDNIHHVRQREQKKVEQIAKGEVVDDEDYPRMVLDSENKHYFLVRLDHFAELTSVDTKTLFEKILTNPSNEGVQNEDPHHILAMVQYDKEENSLYFTNFIRTQPQHASPTIMETTTKSKAAPPPTNTVKAGLSVDIPMASSPQMVSKVTSSSSQPSLKIDEQASNNHVDDGIPASFLQHQVQILQTELQSIQAMKSRLKLLEEMLHQMMTLSEKQQDTIASLQHEVEDLRNEKVRFHRETEAKHQALVDQFAALVNAVEMISQVVTNQ